jgi:hypothetical protein
MHKNEALVRTLCLPFCVYYKPGKNEELLCGGAVVVERLMQSGRRLPLVEKPGTNPDERAAESMVRHLCVACDFREHDCDFIQDRTASPCGGYIYLTQLLASGVITIEDIRKEEK